VWSRVNRINLVQLERDLFPFTRVRRKDNFSPRDKKTHTTSRFILVVWLIDAKVLRVIHLQ